MMDHGLANQKNLYEACFSMTYENILRYQHQSFIERKRMFPGYLFLITDTPELIYEELRRIPKLTQLLSMPEGDQKTFYSLPNEEAEFLYSLIEGNKTGDYCVHRSYIVRRANRIVQAYGALERHLQDVCQVDYKRRRVIVEKELLGQKRRIKFCIYDEVDCRIENIPIPIERAEADKEFPYHVGDTVYLRIEGYDQSPYTIVEIYPSRHTVRIMVELFGRAVEMEVGEEDII